MKAAPATERDADWHDELAANRATFDRLLDRAHRCEERGDFASSAAFCQMAAHVAWLNHTGRFTSKRLEEHLRRLGRALPDEPVTSDLPGRVRVDGERSILHVATALYATGGHTRMVTRWIRLDARSHHDLAVTRQRSGTVREVASTLRIDTARVVSAADVGDTLTERAQRLRSLARHVDVVVLHVHPDDVVPALAFAAGTGGPPVIVVNHADHVFWTGVGVASTVMNLRDSGRRLTIERRRVDAARNVVAVRPLDESARRMSRDDAKVALGLPPDAVVLATVAAASKYDPIANVGLLDLVVPVVAADPNLWLIAAGPSPDDRWADASAATGGRIIAQGELDDPSTVHHAADVYLDSYPFASLTSMLEAGSLGTPLVSYDGHPAGAEVLGADSPGLDDVMSKPTTPAEFAAEVRRLVDDSAARASLGRATAEAIEFTHRPASLLASYDTMYTMAKLAAPMGDIGDDLDGPTGLDLLVVEIQMRTGHAAGGLGAIRRNLSLLSPAERIRFTARCLITGTILRPQDMMSDTCRDHVRSVLTLARRLADRARDTVGRFAGSLADSPD